MVSLHTLLCNATVLFLLSYLACLLPTTCPQTTAPTVARCGPSLLPLASCGPFVQGVVSLPPEACCNALNQLYNQQPGCLCLLLNDTTLRPFPINTTLALQLPALCSLRVDIATCSGVTLPPSSPASQISFGSRSNSTVAATPMVTISPRPTIMGLGYHQNTAEKLDAKYYDHLVMVLFFIIYGIIISG